MFSLLPENLELLTDGCWGEFRSIWDLVNGKSIRADFPFFYILWKNQFNLLPEILIWTERLSYSNLIVGNILRSRCLIILYLDVFNNLRAVKISSKFLFFVLAMGRLAFRRILFHFNIGFLFLFPWVWFYWNLFLFFLLSCAFDDTQLPQVTIFSFERFTIYRNLVFIDLFSWKFVRKLNSRLSFDSRLEYYLRFYFFP